PSGTSPKESNGLQGKTVLIAEDNMINAMVSMKLMDNWGLKASHAKNGIEAVESAQAQPFDFILMDIHMPELDGFDAAKKIRSSLNPNVKTPIFALTADITAHQRKLFEPYFDGFLLKPIVKEKLYGALSGVELSSEA
ncbi:MAG: response regulator, partial [Marinoscillum sp.]